MGGGGLQLESGGLNRFLTPKGGGGLLERGDLIEKIRDLIEKIRHSMFTVMLVNLSYQSYNKKSKERKRII